MKRFHPIYRFWRPWLKRWALGQRFADLAVQRLFFKALSTLDEATHLCASIESRFTGSGGLLEFVELLVHREHLFSQIFILIALGAYDSLIIGGRETDRYAPAAFPLKLLAKY